MDGEADPVPAIVPGGWSSLRWPYLVGTFAIRAALCRRPPMGTFMIPSSSSSTITSPSLFSVSPLRFSLRIATCNFVWRPSMQHLMLHLSFLCSLVRPVGTRTVQSFSYPSIDLTNNDFSFMFQQGIYLLPTVAASFLFYPPLRPPLIVLHYHGRPLPQSPRKS